MSDDDQQISVADAAAMIGCVPMTIYRLMERHELGPVFRSSPREAKGSKVVRLRRSFVQAYIDRNSEQAPAPKPAAGPVAAAGGVCLYWHAKKGCTMTAACKWQSAGDKTRCRVGGQLGGNGGDL